MDGFILTHSPSDRQKRGNMIKAKRPFQKKKPAIFSQAKGYSSHQVPLVVLDMHPKNWDVRSIRRASDA
jgi:hypothetical protein